MVRRTLTIVQHMQQILHHFCELYIKQLEFADEAQEKKKKKKSMKKTKCKYAVNKDSNLSYSSVHFIKLILLKTNPFKIWNYLLVSFALRSKLSDIFSKYKEETEKRFLCGKLKAYRIYLQKKLTPSKQIW